MGFNVLVRFLRMWSFFNPTTEVVTFCLHGWCMLGVFLLLAFTRLGHECQDLLSLCDGIHVCTDKTSVYTHIQKSFGDGVRTHANSKGKILSSRKFFSEEDRTHATVGQRAQHTTKELFWPWWQYDCWILRPSPELSLSFAKCVQ